MLKKLQKYNNKGFTIIEVMIVLAIAGLILLVVFLAVPALQRSQRNNGRASEASRFASSVTNFVSNNQGTVPTTLTEAQSILNDFGTFKYLQGNGGTQLVVPTTAPVKLMTSGDVNITSGVVTTNAITSGSGDAILIDSDAQCGTSGNTMTTKTATNSNQIALIYTTESTTTDYNQVCIQAE